MAKVPEVTLYILDHQDPVYDDRRDRRRCSDNVYFGETTENVSAFWHEYGYLIGAAIFLAIFLIAVVVQIIPRSFTHSSTGRRSLRPPCSARHSRTTSPDPRDSVITGVRSILLSLVVLSLVHLAA